MPNLGSVAEALLFGESIADKLDVLDVDRDEPECPIAIPPSPGRAPHLRFADAGIRVPFPKPAGLFQADARGHLLHFFANHELLAIELFALALLRFPDAPRAFRRGLVGVIRDEQRHLRAYLDRMSALGLAFGDLPLNRYFWTALADAPDISAFVAGMSLTFEQANLDHAAWWQAALARAGDVESAAVMQDVLRDEIRHVRHGAVWFRRWFPDEELFDAWTHRQPNPLTPSRAKGPLFHREARGAAGLSAEFCDRLEVYGASRGRPPVVYTFDPDVESEVGGEPSARAVRLVAEDAAALPIFLGGRDDLVLVRRMPGIAFLSRLQQAGFELPELVPTPTTLVGSPLANRKIGGIEPWGWSPQTCAYLRPLGGLEWRPEWRAAYTKSWSVEHLRRFLIGEAPQGLVREAEVGRVAWEEAEVQALVLTLTSAGYDVVLKAPFSTAGRGLCRWDDPGSARWLAAALGRGDGVVVEPWLRRVVDLSVQIRVGADGVVTTEPWARFETNGRGRYIGAVVARRMDGLDRELQRFLHGNGADPLWLDGVFARIGGQVGAALAAVGFRGNAGIDAFIFRDATDELRLKPLVEVNARTTMGRVAQALAKRVHGGRCAFWRQVTVSEVRRGGWRTIAEWAADVETRAPLHFRGPSALLDRGVLITTDPVGASLFGSALAVGDSLAECRWMVGL